MIVIKKTVMLGKRLSICSVFTLTVSHQEELLCICACMCLSIQSTIVAFIYCVMSFCQFWLMIFWWHNILTVSSSLLAGRVTPEQLCSYTQLFRSSWGALESHCGLLQLGLATAQTLRHPDLPRWDSCLAFERLLLQVRPHLKQTYCPFVLQPIAK